MPAVELSGDVLQRLLDLIRVGNTLEVAAAAVGVDQALMRAYIEAGKEERIGPHREFLDAVSKAQAEAESLDAARIAKASATNWKATAFAMSERRRHKVIRILRGGRA